MKKLLLVLTASLLFGQTKNSQPKSSVKVESVKVDGVTVTKQLHRIDLSMCDYVRLEGPVDEMMVMNGRFDIMMFKKYGSINKFSFTCEVDTRP